MDVASSLGHRLLASPMSPASMAAGVPKVSTAQRTTASSPSKIPHPKVCALSARPGRVLRSGCPLACAPDFLSWGFKERLSVDISSLRPVPEGCKQPLLRRESASSLAPSAPAVFTTSAVCSAVLLAVHFQPACAYWSWGLPPTLRFTSFPLPRSCASEDPFPGQSLTRVVSPDRQHRVCFPDRAVPLEVFPSSAAVPMSPSGVALSPLASYQRYNLQVRSAVCVDGVAPASRPCSAAESVAVDPPKGPPARYSLGLYLKKVVSVPFSTGFFPERK